MLTTFALLLFSLAGLKAQTFTQVSYNFPTSPDVATDGTESHDGWDIDGYFPMMQIPDPSGNYWGGGDMTTLDVPPTGCFTGSTYLSSKPTIPTVYCSDDVDHAKPNHSQPLSVQQVDTTSSCSSSYGEGMILGQQDGEPYQGADTLMYYVEHCYSYEGFNCTVFGNIGNDIAGGHPGGDTLPNLRQWFFNMLYLNPDTLYYCSDAIATLSTFNSEDTFNSKGWASIIAVERYIAESGKCPSFKVSLEFQINNDLFPAWHRFWKDTVTDSLLTPWDTTIPTLQQIGFEALLGPQFAAVQNAVIPSCVLGAIGISPNPFVDNTVIYYTLNVPATLTVDVYDELGQHITSPVPSVFTNNGEYSFTLSGATIPAGTYYIRFSVPEGEVKTIQVVKE